MATGDYKNEFIRNLMQGLNGSGSIFGADPNETFRSASRAADEDTSDGLKREIINRFRSLLKLNGITPPAGSPNFQIKRNAAGKIRLEVTFG